MNITSIQTLYCTPYTTRPMLHILLVICLLYTSCSMHPQTTFHPTLHTLIYRSYSTHFTLHKPTLHIPTVHILRCTSTFYTPSYITHPTLQSQAFRSGWVVNSLCSLWNPKKNINQQAWIRRSGINEKVMSRTNESCDARISHVTLNM